MAAPADDIELECAHINSTNSAFASYPVCELDAVVMFHPIGPGNTFICDNQTSGPVFDESEDRAHFAMHPNEGTPRDPLVVFLPGSGMFAGDGLNVLQAAAWTGFRGVSLSYRNSPSVTDVCASPPSQQTVADCVAERRCDVSLGNGALADDMTPDVVGAEDSIAGRLYSLLRRLDDDFMGMGWGSYLTGVLGVCDGNETMPPVDPAQCIDWNRIVLVGFSQGSGNALLLARLHQLHALVLLGGPKDVTSNGDYLDLDPSLMPHLTLDQSDVDPDNCTFDSTTYETKSARVFGLHHVLQGAGAAGAGVAIDAIQRQRGQLYAIWDAIGILPIPDPLPEEGVAQRLENATYWDLSRTAVEQGFSTGDGKLIRRFRTDAAVRAQGTDWTTETVACDAHGAQGHDACMEPNATEVPEIFPIFQHIFCLISEMPIQ